MSKLLRAFLLFISALLPIVSFAVIIFHMAESRTEGVIATIVVASALSLSLLLLLIVLSQETRFVSERQETIRRHASSLARCMRNLNQRVSEIEHASSVVEKAGHAKTALEKTALEKAAFERTARRSGRNNFLSPSSESDLEALRLDRVTAPSDATNENQKTAYSSSSGFFDDISTSKACAPKDVALSVETIFTLPQRKPWGVEIRPASSSRLWNALRKEEPLALEPSINEAVKIYESFLKEEIKLRILLPLTRDFFSDGAAIRSLNIAIRRYPELGRLLFLGISQSDVRRASADEVTILGALAETGLKLALTQIVDVRFDPKTLRDCNVRLVQIDSSVLLSNIDSGMIETEIGQPTIGQALHAQGIEFLCRNVRRHDYIPELLDQQVTLVQGEALESVSFPLSEASKNDPLAVSLGDVDTGTHARARWMRAVG